MSFPYFTQIITTKCGATNNETKSNFYCFNIYGSQISKNSYSIKYFHFVIFVSGSNVMFSGICVIWRPLLPSLSVALPHSNSIQSLHASIFIHWKFSLGLLTMNEIEGKKRNRAKKMATTATASAIKCNRAIAFYMAIFPFSIVFRRFDARYLLHILIFMFILFHFIFI